LYINFSSEYIVIPHNQVSVEAIPKLSYFSIRSGRKPNWDSKKGQGTGRASSSGLASPDNMMQEHWIVCDDTCEAPFPANYVPDNAPWRGCDDAKIEDLEIFGDEEFLISRMGRVLSVFTFDSCTNGTIFA
jgi:hypothetical protein